MARVQARIQRKKKRIKNHRDKQHTIKYIQGSAVEDRFPITRKGGDRK